MTANEILAMPTCKRKFDIIMNMADSNMKYFILSQMKDAEHDSYCGYWLKLNPVDWSAYGIFLDGSKK